jgi:hypothetical protein
MTNAAPRSRLSCQLPRLVLIAGLCCVATPLPADAGSARANHASSTGGAAAGRTTVPNSRHARRCDPPPCPTRGNAALPKNEEKP